MCTYCALVLFFTFSALRFFTQFTSCVLFCVLRNCSLSLSLSLSLLALVDLIVLGRVHPPHQLPVLPSSGPDQPRKRCRKFHPLRFQLLPRGVVHYHQRRRFCTAPFFLLPRRRAAEHRRRSAHREGRRGLLPAVRTLQQRPHPHPVRGWFLVLAELPARADRPGCLHRRFVAHRSPIVAAAHLLTRLVFAVVFLPSRLSHSHFTLLRRSLSVCCLCAFAACIILQPRPAVRRTWISVAPASRMVPLRWLPPPSWWCLPPLRSSSNLSMLSCVWRRLL
jgi:hypothetical protein